MHTYHSCGLCVYNYAVAIFTPWHMNTHHAGLSPGILDAWSLLQTMRVSERGRYIQFADRPTRGQSSRGLVNLRTIDDLRTKSLMQNLG